MSRVYGMTALFLAACGGDAECMLFDEPWLVSFERTDARCPERPDIVYTPSSDLTFGLNDICVSAQATDDANACTLQIEADGCLEPGIVPYDVTSSVRQSDSELTGAITYAFLGLGFCTYNLSGRPL